MSFHVICPSLRCRKILTLADEARGALVTCRYCLMQFRVPRYRVATAASATTRGRRNLSTIDVPSRGNVKVK
jgi:hypothetical protein